jgi:predicted RNA binding protein YcfA (HicA-like mRNA interferase family)
MDARAKTAQTRYYALRLVAIVGGVLVPALVGLKLGDAPASIWIFRFTFFLSLMVAVSIAVEEFFHYGERWRHYRRIVEMLKSEGWQFFQLAGSYQKYENHGEAYSVFASRVEDILHQDIEMFFTQMAREKKEQGKGEGEGESVG